MSKKAERAALTQEEVRDLFDYDEETGWLTWRARSELSNYQVGRLGTRAGTVNKQGYRYVGIGNVIYRDTSIIWLWMTGEKPQAVLTHNGDRQDVRWSNLRAQQPGQERRLTATTGSYVTHGVAGIRRTENGRFLATIHVDGKTHRLGIHDSMEEAIAARRKAEVEMLVGLPRLQGRPEMITLNGMTMNVSQWCRHFGIRRETFRKRLAANVPFERMGEPVSKTPGRPRTGGQA